MDFKSYITAVEKQLNKMTEAQKTEWIYAQARIVEEHERADFLSALEGKKTVHMEFEPDAISNWCKQVEEGKIYFETEEYEYYEEGAWDADWQTEYHDTFGIADYLEKAVNVCEQLLMQKEYKQSFRLLDRICRLEFQTESEYDEMWEYDGLTLENLVDEDIISIDLRKISLCLLYACYQTNTGKKRIQKLYGYLEWKLCNSVLMTDVFAYGPEKIEDEAAFMKEWSAFLMNTSGDRAAKLLVDACIYLGGDTYLLETAAKNVMVHPYLYKACCERKLQCQDYEACIAIAERAVNEINGNKVIRAEISDIAVCAARAIGVEWDKRHFYQKAFYSNPNSRHLLRLYQLNDKTAIAEALERVLTIQFISPSPNMTSAEQRETAISDSGLKTIYRFLLGDYREIMKICRKDNTYLGWSSNIKGRIVPLLLLYLKKDEKQKTYAERRLIEQVKYQIRFEDAEGESFDEYLSVWRQSYEMPEEDRQNYIEWLLQEIDKRTENVVGGGYRKSYYKAAELIVMIGAIQEERGETYGMHRLVEYYKKQHSRKRAFREEIDALAKISY